MSFMYTMNTRGPNIDPRGTPVDMAKGEDTLSSIWTYCILPLIVTLKPA